VTYEKSTVGALSAAVLALATSGVARADWLAADPGTAISLQLNASGVYVVRPIGGTWSHLLCSDVTAAVLTEDNQPLFRKFDRLVDMLVAAAATGSIVNIYAEPDQCHSNGFPLVRNVRIQGP